MNQVFGTTKITKSTKQITIRNSATVFFVIFVFFVVQPFFS